MSRFHGSAAHDYDARIQQLVPGYDTLHLLTVAQLMARLPDRARILVVGAGTGSEILGLANYRPSWHFAATDLSADMLAVARQRCHEAGIASRVQFHVGELDGFVDDRPYDAALALLVVHFLPDDGCKQGLLSAIAARLRPDAPLLLADLMHPADPQERSAHLQASQLLGMAPEAAVAMGGRLRSDFHPLGAERLGALVAEAGFGPPVPYFQALGFRAVVALRQPPYA